MKYLVTKSCCLLALLLFASGCTSKEARNRPHRGAISEALTSSDPSADALMDEILAEDKVKFADAAVLNDPMLPWNSWRRFWNVFLST